MGKSDNTISVVIYTQLQCRKKIVVCTLMNKNEQSKILESRGDEYRCDEYARWAGGH